MNKNDFVYPILDKCPLDGIHFFTFMSLARDLQDTRECLLYMAQPAIGGANEMIKWVQNSTKNIQSIKLYYIYNRA